jgi:hypothetical protein
MSNEIKHLLNAQNAQNKCTKKLSVDLHCRR